jgi:hypothetical protein
VEFDTRYYSVPYQLVHEPVDVRATAHVVEVLHRNRRVTSHVREYGRRRFITKPEHMPAAHRAHLEWTPSKLVAWGASVGPAVAELIDTILTTRPHPEHGYRACMGLKRLVKQYGGERVSAACQRALTINGCAVRAVALSPFGAARPIATTRVDSAASACDGVRLTRSDSAWPHVCPRRRSSTNVQSVRLDSLVNSAVTTVACL